MLKRKLKSITLAALVAATSASALMLATAPDAQALPRNIITYTYYATAAHSSVVGERTMGSCIGVHSWGETTSYYTVTTEPCP